VSLSPQCVAGILQGAIPKPKEFLLTQIKVLHTIYLMKKLLTLLALGASLILVRSATVTLGWDAPTGPNTSFKLYYGTQTGVYPLFAPTTNTSVQIGGLIRGTPYYFAVSAVQTNNVGTNKVALESTLSQEVTYTPAPLPAAPANLRLISE
jgi:hypothetical protein